MNEKKKFMKIALFVPVLLLAGCSYVSKPADPAAPLTQEDQPTTVPEKIIAAVKPKPVIFQNGAHPTVRHDYYEMHKHAFDCKDDPYSCKECPVGSPERAISFTHGAYRDVPVEINRFFACYEINTLVPEAGFDVDSDQFLCQRSPQDGFVKFGDKVYSCKQEQDDSPAQTFNLGTIQPGESKTVTIPVTVQQ
jgi:hypothetical protein